MPYPSAHPALVIPLRRALGRYGVPSALVIGSIVPDLWPFVPGIDRAHSHSLPGLFWFSLPLGLALYLLFHLLLKHALVDLLPRSAAARLGCCLEEDRLLPRAGWFAVLVSLALGVASHLAWDAFTHADGWAVESFPAFRGTFYAYAGQPLSVYRLLQHASTLFGTAYVVAWSWRWFAKAPPGQHQAAARLSARARRRVALALPGAALVGALLSVAQIAEPISSFDVLRRLVRAALFDAALGFFAALFLYALWWKSALGCGSRGRAEALTASRSDRAASRVRNTSSDPVSGRRAADAWITSAAARRARRCPFFPTD